ncbi:MAG: N-acetylneuraminate synthase family protein [Bacillota bacterium]
MSLADHLPLPPGRTLVIAEIGVNHDGSLTRALELVDHAAACGADAVKLQIFRAKALMHASAAFAGYQKDRCAEADPAAMLRRYELSAEDIRRVVHAIRERHLLPLATPFSLADVDAMAELDLPAIKIASPDLVNWPLLKRAAALGRPLLVSTGAATMEETATTVAWLRAWQVPFALLHCVSSYPTPIEQANLCWIHELSRRFAVPVGFSDHTPEEMTGALAVAAGATIVEKHLTYDRNAAGPDHAASVDPPQFARYVSAIRLAKQLCGSPGKRVLPVEEDVRRVSRQSLVLTRAVDAGQPLTETDLTTQRPGMGIPAAALPQVIGRHPRLSLPAGTMLQWDMLA